ncbi:tumor necrosis factor receptor superfamily member 17 [Brienomyrus brachyistius]|uniref:tumor necrosis factor receptor superfamily member 17 n=1 Tax=Brienomyrus brachyistius TaxID=42636 RepID=UPI0020B36AD0|nr:tumor necrosis factor receptor superfamily member 17 [Brienomyrus brachyistius]
MAKSKCAKNSYYDGLLEKCKPCYLRCSSSPPISCTEYCTKPSDSPVPENNNVWVIVLVFLLLNAFTTMILIVQVLRKKKCRQVSLKTGFNQDQVEDFSGKVLDAEKQIEIKNDGCVTTGYSVQKEKKNDSNYNSSLPLPSTEEGTTILVTTKTTQAYSIEEKALGQTDTSSGNGSWRRCILYS